MVLLLLKVACQLPSAGLNFGNVGGAGSCRWAVLVISQREKRHRRLSAWDGCRKGATENTKVTTSG
jgi:hypothetical protein